MAYVDFTVGIARLRSLLQLHGTKTPKFHHAMKDAWSRLTKALTGKTPTNIDDRFGVLSEKTSVKSCMQKSLNILRKA